MRTCGRGLLALLCILLGVVVSIQACSGERITAASDEPGVEDPDDRVSIYAAYAAQRADPGSFGKRHNRELDVLLAQVRVRRAELGRRLLPTDFCEVLQDFGRLRMAQGLAAPRWSDNPLLQEKRFVEECREPASADRPLRTAGDFVPVTWVDSIFDTEWHDWEFDLITPDEDIALLEDVVMAAIAEVEASASLQDLEDAVSLAMQQMGSTSVEAAELTGMIGAFTVESATYWDENYEEWLDQFCSETQSEGGGDGPDGPCDEPADVGPAGVDGADFWEGAVEFIGSDVMSTISIGAGIIGALRDAKGRYERAGRDAGRASTQLREQIKDLVTRSEGRRAVIRKAGRLVRSSTLLGLVAGAAIDSAIGAVSD